MSVPGEQLPNTVLIVEPDEAVRALLQPALAPLCATRMAATLQDAREICQRLPILALLIRDALPDGRGMELAGWAAETYPRAMRVIYGGRPTLEEALHAINTAHIHSWLPGPPEIGALTRVLQWALATHHALSDQSETIEQLRKTNHQLESKLKQNTREVIALNEEIRLVLDEMEMLTLTDAQTSLHNRRAMIDRLEEFFQQSRRYNSTLSCVSIIITNFQDWLDAYDIEENDLLLQEIAQRIRQTIRNVDVACRANVDEFLVILPFTDGEKARISAQRLLHQLADFRYAVPAGERTLSFAVGSAEMTATVTKSSLLVQLAREAAAKSHVARPISSITPRGGGRPESP